MRAMDTDQPESQDLAHLREAFATFSRVSGELQVSYSGLQRQVDQLHAELHRSNEMRAAESERSRQLAHTDKRGCGGQRRALVLARLAWLGPVPKRQP